jgi:hypothetical protein
VDEERVDRTVAHGRVVYEEHDVGVEEGEGEDSEADRGWDEELERLPR